MAQEPPVEFMDGKQLDFAASIYEYEGVAARAVRALKYGRDTSIAAWMAERISEAARGFGLEFDTVAPVPIHWSRRAHRGFNQSELLSEGMNPRLDLLARIRKTRPQVGLSLEERSKNLAGAFLASPKVQGLRVLLIDDVLTSGHTARECATALRACGATGVGILAFAGENLAPDRRTTGGTKTARLDSFA